MKIKEENGRLVITDFDEIEAYRIACAIEKDGIKFYQKMLGCVHSFEAQHTLEVLIGEEKKHLKFFEECLYRLRETKEDLSEENDLLSSMDFGIFQPYESIDEMCDIVEDLKKAINLGIIIEKKSIDFYEICKKSISSPEVKKELELIIGQEHQHKELLEAFKYN